MNLFAGKIVVSANDDIRSNFDDLSWALCTVYQIISLEKWQIVYHKCLVVADELVVNLFFFSLLLFGNFVLKNVFLAGVLGIFQQTRNNIKERKFKAFSIIKSFNIRGGKIYFLIIVKKKMIFKLIHNHLQQELGVLKKAIL